MAIYVGNHIITPSGIDKVYVGNTCVYLKPDESGSLYIKANQAGSTVTISAFRAAPAVQIEYSLDNETWNNFTVGQTVITLANIGDMVWFRGTNQGLAVDSFVRNGFVFTGSVSAGGDATTLLNPMGVTDLSTYNAYALAGLFQDCTQLTKAPALPATVLVDHCYASMFMGCTGLRKCPKLPATDLAPYCYGDMFRSCTSITSVPTLPATVLKNDCYHNMFIYSGVVTAPSINATGADNCCENMFYECPNLTSVGDIIINGGRYRCKSMFSGCTSLVSHGLVRGTLAIGCYQGMFGACTNLITIDKFIYTSSQYKTDCFASMYQGCAKIKLSTQMSSDYPTSYTFIAAPGTTYGNNMFKNTGGTFTGTPTGIQYYTSNTVID